MRLHADRVDDGVRAPAAGEVPYGVPHVLAVDPQIQGVHAPRGGALQPVGHQIHPDDEPGPAVQGDPGRHVADRPEPEDGQAAARGHRRVFDGLPGGRKHVRQIDEPVVGRAVRDLDGQGVAEGDAEQLGLPAGHLTVELGVAEQRGTAAVLPDLGGLALRLEPLAAHEAVTAGDVERDHDTVPAADRRHVGAGLLDDAHRLVPQDVARVEVGAEHLVEMQVRAADAAGGDPHDDVRGFLDDRVGDRLDTDVAPPLPGQCTHALSSLVRVDRRCCYPSGVSRPHRRGEPGTRADRPPPEGRGVMPLPSGAPGPTGPIG